MNNHISVLHSFGIDLTDSKELSLPKLFWIPKLHKYPYKQRFIAGSSTCSTKALSRILTIILSKIKQGLQKYCDTIYSRCGINHMWILKNSKTLLEYLHSHSFDKVTSIKTFDFSTLYTTIPHSSLKERLAQIIHQAFYFKTGVRKYEFVVVKNGYAYFVKHDINAKHMYSDTDIIIMLNLF